MLLFCLLLQLFVTTTVYTKENVLSLRVARVLRDTAEKDVRYVSVLVRRRKLGWLYSFRACTKIIPERVSVHTEKQLRRRDSCDGAKLRRADLKSGALHIGEVLRYT